MNTHQTHIELAATVEWDTDGESIEVCALSIQAGKARVFLELTPELRRRFTEEIRDAEARERILREVDAAADRENL